MLHLQAKSLCACIIRNSQAFCLRNLFNDDGAFLLFLCIGLKILLEIYAHLNFHLMHSLFLLLVELLLLHSFNFLALNMISFLQVQSFHFCRCQVVKIFILIRFFFIRKIFILVQILLLI